MEPSNAAYDGARASMPTRLGPTQWAEAPVYSTGHLSLFFCSETNRALFFFFALSHLLEPSESGLRLGRCWHPFSGRSAPPCDKAGRDGHRPQQDEEKPRRKCSESILRGSTGIASKIRWQCSGRQAAGNQSLSSTA